MTDPKQTAKEIVDKYRGVGYCYEHWQPTPPPCIHSAKACAIIHVNGIIDAYKDANVEYEDGEFIKHWESIKQEINKL